MDVDDDEAVVMEVPVDALFNFVISDSKIESSVTKWS